MKRRSFIATLVQTVAAAAVAANLVREDAIAPIKELTWQDELEHSMAVMREAARKAFTDHYRSVYLDLLEGKTFPNQLGPTFHG